MALLNKRTIIVTTLGILSGVLVSFTWKFQDKAGDHLELLQESSAGLIFGVIFAV